MFLHLGSDTVVNIKEIVAIFDMDNTTISKQSRKFLAQAQKNGQVIDTSEELPKSYIVTNANGKTKVYISSVSSQTLLKRSRMHKILY